MEETREKVQVQLPATLVQQVQQAILPDQAIEQVLTEAIQMWLDRQQKVGAEAQAEQTLLFLRQAGLVMSEERQRAFAQAIKATLEIDKNASRAEIEEALAHLDPPLSQEIIEMRGEH